VSGKGGVQANWRAVTGVNTTGLRIGVSGGNRGGVQAVSTQDYTAAHKGIGVETSVDFEAQYAGMGFDDVRAIGAKTGLEACMLGEELLILGGNTDDRAHLAPSAVECRQSHADPHPPGLLSDRVAAARPALRDRSLCRRGVAAAGVTLKLRDGFYDVESEVGALLIVCFGFVAAEDADNPKPRPLQYRGDLVRCGDEHCDESVG
jgi:hypothetical protein